MLTKSLHSKWVAQLFVLMYLLLITSTGNAFFWCTGAETSSHLESNPGGKCWTPCHSEPEENQRNEQTPKKSVVFSSGMDDCADFPVYSTVITSQHQNRLKSRIIETDNNTPSPLSITIRRLNNESLGILPLPDQLPPRLALTAFRTVALLL
jgi:hypothetical protein